MKLSTIKSIVAAALCAVGLSAFAVEPKPLLVPDYNRDGKINKADRDRVDAGETFTIWLNDDDDDDGTDDGEEAGDTNVDLHDVPGGEGNDRDCEDDKVNGRCDLLDFFPVLIDVNGVEDWNGMTWKLSSDSVNVVFTQLEDGNAGSFHTQEAKALDDETPLYTAEVKKLAEEGEVDLPDGFLKEGRGVILVEGAALLDGGITLRGEGVEVTLDLRVKNVEDMYGWLNLRSPTPTSTPTPTPTPTPTSTPTPDKRHFILVHGYNTNHEEARGNAAEFYKKLWQSGSDAMFTAVEWRGDQSQMKFETLGITFSPNYHVNVENAFAAARPFADACRKLPGEKILVGHSLGNMLVSSAIKDYGLDYAKYVMLNAAVAREAYDASAYDEGMVSILWEDAEEGGLDRASRWYRNFADSKYDPDEYRRKLAWRGRFANLPRTVNYYSPTDDLLANPAVTDLDDLDEMDAQNAKMVQPLLAKTMKFGGFWSLSEKMKGRPTLIDTINGVLTNVFGMAESDVYKCEGGWGVNEDYDEDPKKPFDPANTHFTPFLDARLKAQGMLDILPASAERARAQHLADAIPAESFAAGANPVATLENVNMEGFIGDNQDWPVYEQVEGEERMNEWKHSAFREVAFYHASKLYASLAEIGKPRVIIDTDLGSSIDDLFALDFAARMHKQGKLDLMAVMMDRPDGCDPAGEGRFLDFADRYLNTLGFGKDFPLGKSEPLSAGVAPPVVINPYWTLVSSNAVADAWFKSSGRELDAVTNAVALYRQLLDEAPDKSVTICSIGFFNNLKALMESEPNYGLDGIALSGLELVAQKVKELRIMGGCFDGSVVRERGVPGEYNVMGDIPSATKIFAEWPTPIVVTPWEVGTKLEYKPEDVLGDFPVGTLSPTVRAVYECWPNPPEGFIDRLWDPMTLLPLTDGETFAPLSEKGGISVDGDGRTTFTPQADGTRRYQVATGMDAAAVMNRLREICRTGNPSVSMLAGGESVPGVDYNGSELVFRFEDIRLGSFSEGDLKFKFAVGGAEFEPESSEWDETLGVLSVRFAIPSDAVTAGNVYDGKLTVMFENDVLGTNVLLSDDCRLVQGRQEQEAFDTGWFNETDLELPTNYVPATAMPAQCRATVETTVLFDGQTFVVEYRTAPDAVQGAVRIVEDGKGGYKFQYYACVGNADDDYFVRGWWDFNFAGEGAEEIKPVRGESYTVFAEGRYFEDARGGENTLVVSAKPTNDNRNPKTQFIGNLVNAQGVQGGTTRLDSVGLAGEGTVASLVGNYYGNNVNANLAEVNGTEYATVAAAVAAADGQPVRLLHAASWMPTEADIGKPVKFLDKSRLVLDLSGLPAKAQAVWTDVDGDDGTLTFSSLAVRNVMSRQRYPWNGLVDVSCDLTGAGTVTLGVTALTNGVEFIANPTLEGETTIDLDAAGGVTNGVMFIWNAAADLPAGFKAQGVQIKVSAEK